VHIVFQRHLQDAGKLRMQRRLATHRAKIGMVGALQKADDFLDISEGDGQLLPVAQLLLGKAIGALQVAAGGQQDVGHIFPLVLASRIGIAVGRSRRFLSSFPRKSRMQRRPAAER